MLVKKFESVLCQLGMERLEHPLFYHAPVGIRFGIGGEETIYLDGKPNPVYVQGALDRAAAIYRSLPIPPDILRIDGYPEEETDDSVLTTVRKMAGLPVPQEQEASVELDEDGDAHRQIRFYWDLK